MKTKLLKKLRLEAFKRVKIQSNYGGETPVYSIKYDGDDILCSEFEVLGKNSLITDKLDKAKTALFRNRKNLISDEVAQMRIVQRKKEQNRLLNI